LLKERIMYESQTVAGSLDRMIMDAVLMSSFDDIADVFNRFAILVRMSRATQEKSFFAQACKIAERTKNITKSSRDLCEGEVRVTLCTEAAERQLYAAYQETATVITDLLAAKEYEKVTREYAQRLYTLLYAFFDTVLVNVDDDAVRRNRLCLMQHIHKLYAATIADLSMVRISE